MFWKNERWFYDLEATSKYMLYLLPETERVRNQAGIQLPTQIPPEMTGIIVK